MLVRRREEWVVPLTMEANLYVAGVQGTLVTSMSLHLVIEEEGALVRHLTCQRDRTARHRMEEQGSTDWQPGLTHWS